MKWILGGVFSVVAVSIAACSGGGGGGGSSSSARGTGYLKLNLPTMTGSVVSSSQLKPMGMVFQSESIGQNAFFLKTLTTNTNNGNDCNGVVESIPFLVCMVESVGISQPGTYSGTLNGVALEAVATQLTGDPDGYILQAVVTKNTAEIFRYKADADGTKGEIRYKISGFWEVLGRSTDPLLQEERVNWIKWDSTTSTAAVLETAEEWQEDYNNATTVTHAVRYMKALIDEDAGIADIVTKRSSKVVRNAYSPAEQQINTEIFQTRVKGDAVVEGYTRCAELSTSTALVLGTDCWNYSTNNSGTNNSTNIDWSVYSYADTYRQPSDVHPGDLVGGTWSSSGYSHLDELVLSGSFGSKALPGGNFGNTTLDDLLTAQRAGSHAFSFQVDHTITSPTVGSVAALAKDAQDVSFATLDALIP